MRVLYALVWSAVRAGANCTVKLEAEMPVAKGRLRLAQKKLAEMPQQARFLTANHKTGSYLAMCLAKVLGQHGIYAQVASIHTSGGFSPHALQLNMIRDPFSLVDSGYVYHSRKTEKWLKIPFATLLDPVPRIDENAQAARAAYLAVVRLSQSCSDSVIEAPRVNETYGDAVGRLSLESGLLLESLRALYRDVPYVAASALDCTRYRNACTSILLDDVKVAGYGVAFDALATTLALPDAHHPDIKRAFVGDCDPAAGAVAPNSVSSDAPARRKRKVAGASKDSCSRHVHVTSGCGGRAERVDVIKTIDRRFLGSALERANATITSLALRILPHQNKASV